MDFDQTIEHCGGRMMRVMTGVRLKAITEVPQVGEVLQLTFPLGAKRRVLISLRDDLYTVTAYKTSRPNSHCTLETGVYAEQLKSTLEELTGLRFSL